MRFPKDTITTDRGASMVEYGLIVSVIALVALSAVTLVGEKTGDTFTAIAGSLEGDGSAQTPGGPDNESDDSGSSGGDQTGGDQNGGDQNGGNEQQGDPGEQDDSNDDSDEEEEEVVEEVVEEVEEEEALPAAPTATGTSSALYWWDSNAKKGQWKADVSYSNDTNRHQYLTLEITQIDDKGMTTTTTVSGFYVSAGGNSTYTMWSNDINLNNRNVKGVVEVEVKVLSVRTSDENWQSYSYDVNGSATSILPPALP